MMSCHFQNILSQWIADKDNTEWVLAAVYQTVGSSYRKAGAFMMFSGDGRKLGLVSGGCLESDIQKHAKHVTQVGQSKTIRYDGDDEDDLSFQLGIGCGGVVDIVLHPVSIANNYLELETLYRTLCNGQSANYSLLLSRSNRNTQAIVEVKNTDENYFDDKSRLQVIDGEQWLISSVTPAIHLLVCGGGYDARPLVAMAAQLSWKVSVWDPRPANARHSYFPAAENHLHFDEDALAAFVDENEIDAAILMTHSISLDAKALKSVIGKPLQYVALLGPEHRKMQVFEVAGVSWQQSSNQVAGPAGLDIGGRLPESIALSILAECHAVLASRNAISISGMVKTSDCSSAQTLHSYS